MPRNPGDNRPGTGPGNGGGRDGNPYRRHDGGTSPGRDGTPGQPPPEAEPKTPPKE